MSTEIFTIDDLREMVKLIGAELEHQDAFIRESTAKNAAYEECRGQGITYLRNEHYYQFAAVRALLPTFRFRVKPEYRRFDLGLFGQFGPKPVALGEIKLWMSSRGERELPWIVKDMTKLFGARCATFLLIFSAHPPGKTAENVGFLLDRLGGFSETELYKFATSFVFQDGRVREGEFAVLGGLLRSEQLMAALKAQGVTEEMLRAVLEQKKKEEAQSE